jgi:hypothetical protein
MSLLKVLCGSTAANVLWGSNALGRPKTQNFGIWRGSYFYDTGKTHILSQPQFLRWFMDIKTPQKANVGL